jgi:stress-induced morphogen
MKSRKKMWLAAGAALAVILLAGALLLLYRTWNDWRRTGAQLDASQRELRRLFGMNPFPSQRNIDSEKKNLAALRTELAKLQKALREGEIKPVPQSPSAFNAQFWSVQKDLLAEAKARNVMVPDNYSFGFQRHMEGVFADHQDVPRLTQQLLMVQELCRLLYNAKITELKSIVRQEFEGGDVAAPARGAANADNPVVKDAGLIPEGRLSGQLHFTFRFTARSSALREALNQIARHRMIMAVTRCEIAGEDWHALAPRAATPEKKEKTTAAPRPIAKILGRTTPAPEAAPEKPEGPLPRDQRMVCGREVLLDVILDLDVYNFRPEETGGPS